MSADVSLEQLRTVAVKPGYGEVAVRMVGGAYDGVLVLWRENENIKDMIVSTSQRNPGYVGEHGEFPREIRTTSVERYVRRAREVAHWLHPLLSWPCAQSVSFARPAWSGYYEMEE